MSDMNEIREGEVVAEGLPEPGDAALVFIGRIRTPWTDRSACPRQGDPDGPICRLELAPPWERALVGLDAHETLEVFYWLHRSRRDLLVQRRKKDGLLRGTFSLRSPVRPNPIGTSIARLVGIEGSVVLVRGLDCLDGTPLIDLKPERRR
ncbi:SAM-dependent methyltransferase [uncultured Alsobacter sp.]|uniref:SAM-dependent methyltransferase n=1 Tax=uncultured Alsobacter sp. TaxID=1748258 RepID=UPI0025DE9257|nr:SAM-dependent methyltransferase [uncultured Alsobacter sp.]